MAEVCRNLVALTFEMLGWKSEPANEHFRAKEQTFADGNRHLNLIWCKENSVRYLNGWQAIRNGLV